MRVVAATKAAFQSDARCRLTSQLLASLAAPAIVHPLVRYYRFRLAMEQRRSHDFATLVAI
ncbi:hypothetical protein D3C71_453700 [compost metagenome]